MNSVVTARQPSHEIRKRPKDLILFCRVSLCATAAAIVASIVGALKLPYPHNSPFVIDGYSFTDYFDYFQRFHLFLHSANFFTAPGYPFTYLATGVPLYAFFYSFGLVHGLIVYFLLASFALGFAFVRVRSALLNRDVLPFSADSLLLVLLLTSYPVATCLERGNLEIFLAAGIALGTWAYWKQRAWQAAILWGIFGSVKLYPLLLLAIFLSFRQYRQFFLAVAAALGATIIALFYIGPDFNAALAGVVGSLPRFSSLYTLTYNQWIGFDHSIFALLKVIFHPSTTALPRLLKLYFIVITATMLAIYLVRIRKLPAANQLLIFSICSVLLPPTSWDYSLLQLYAPLIVLVFVAIDSGESIRGLSAALVLLAILFTPTNFFSSAGDGRSGQIKCILLITLLTISLIRRFTGREFSVDSRPQAVVG